MHTLYRGFEHKLCFAVLFGRLYKPCTVYESQRWSDALSELAQQTAEKCDFKTGYNGSQSVGENTLSTPASVASKYGDLVGSQWFAEFQSYNYPSGGCSTICSHYTEVRRRACMVDSVLILAFLLPPPPPSPLFPHNPFSLFLHSLSSSISTTTTTK